MNVPAQPSVFYLHGYITSAGDYKQIDQDCLTFQHIFVNSPADCDTAIVQADAEVWIVDLTKAMQTANKKSPIGADLYVGDYIAFPNENAAIMAALMMRS